MQDEELTGMTFGSIHNPDFESEASPNHKHNENMLDELKDVSVKLMDDKYDGIKNLLDLLTVKINHFVT